MECNRDEAIRAKDIAVRRFTAKDFSGAKKIALRAQTLYPPLEGISQMLTTIDVHIAAENQVGGEMDLYGMLGVNPMADDEMIKKQYKKLVLLLHPDKNKSIGADNAFQLVVDAFAILSDKAKRSAYNTQRHIRMAQKVPSQSGVSGGAQNGIPVRQPTTSRVVDQQVPAQTASPAVPHGANGNYNRPGSSLSRGKAQKNGAEKASAQSFFNQGDTFWTVCVRCQMQYEYMRVYLGQMLKCPKCKVCFAAVEVYPPSNISPLGQETRPHSSGVHDSWGGPNARWSPSGTNDYNSSVHTSAAHGGRKRENEAAQGAGQWNTGFILREDGPSKRMREMGVNGGKNYGGGFPSHPGNSMGRANGFTAYCARINATRELSTAEVKNMIAEKALAELSAEVRKIKLAVEKNATTKEKTKAKEKERPKSKLAKSMLESGSHDKSYAVDAAEVAVPEFTVPDPDFHIFDYDRSERCFGENQVWAAYDNDDGMPRFYALVHEVVSLDPFNLKISWLNSRSNNEFGSLDWVGRGFFKTSGDFWVGKHEPNDLLNSFSHKVKWDKGPRGVFQIYPKEGDIWALYRNWSPDWNQLTSNEVIHAYDMVEVLEDYNNEKGVCVASIIKTPGFRTVYQMQPNPKVVKHIPKEEMFRFSHQVPHHILTGYEKPNAPKGFVELDPAATPVDLLQVIPATNNEQVTGFGSTSETQSRKHQ